MGFLRKPPLWSLILIVLAASGSAAYAAVSTGIISIPSSHGDFSVAAAPASQGVLQGITRARITVTSINGYAGTVSLSATVSPGGTNSPTVEFSPASVTLSANSVVTANLNISSINVVGTTTLLPYNITIVGQAGGVSHSTRLSVTILTPQGCYPGFICPSTSDPLFISVSQDPNTLQVSQITIDNHSAGSISVYSYYYTDSYKVQVGSQYTVSLGGIGPNGINTFNPTQPGVPVYGITVLWKTPPPPPTITSPNKLNQSWVQMGPPREFLSIEGYTSNYNNNLTLFVRNSGTTAVTLVSYSVKDAAGDKYTLTSWAGPTIAPTALVSVKIYIGSACSSCVLTGNPFMFAGGNTVTLVTSRANQFSMNL